MLRSSTLIVILSFYFSVQAQTKTGELKKWHRVTISFDGPNVSENDSENPFTDYRLNTLFTSPSGNTYLVPGFFAADGDAANTSADSGNQWNVHFSPDEIGIWTFEVSFRNGTNIAVSVDAQAGSSVSFDGASGNFNVAPTDKSGIDNRANGRLKYVNEHYLKYSETQTYFLKAGTDSPENLLAYTDFDGTSNHGGTNYLKSWSPHVQDWNTGDPTWQNEKGKGLIGAINYLSEKGMNVFSFLTMNVNGDGKDVWPWVSHNARNRFDVSKLAQWEIVFQHAEEKGMYLHFKTQETENDQLLNGGNVGLERKLYYRELIARFGHHLALNWNLGEENTQTTSQRLEMAQFFRDNDPYNHHIVIHTYPNQQNQVYNPLLGGNSELTGASIQTSINNVNNSVLNWIESSANAGKPWVVASDEIGPANTGVAADDDYTGNTGNKPDNREQVLHKTLWGSLLAGGTGVEYYFGYQTGESDLTCQDFRSREHKWNDAKHALDFFRNHLEFWDMESLNNITSDNDFYSFGKIDETYVIYVPGDDNSNLNIGNSGDNYILKWYDPKNGGTLQDGSVTEVVATGNIDFGNPPNNSNEDWILLLRNEATLNFTGLNENNNLVIYPNPANDFLQLKGLSEGIHQFNVFNKLGQKVLVATSHDRDYQLNVSSLKTGLYILNIKSGDLNESYKFLIE
ncbi:MAG: DUF5060 domain-containing protein [Bacteroidota bacterium]